MKTMSLTKIALALLVSIPALSLHGTGESLMATMPKPSLWSTFRSGCSKVGSVMKHAASTTWTGTKSFCASHPKTLGAIAGTAALGAIAYKLVNVFQQKARFAFKDQQEAWEKMMARKDRQEAAEAKEAQETAVRVQKLEEAARAPKTVQDLQQVGPDLSKLLTPEGQALVATSVYTSTRAAGHFN